MQMVITIVGCQLIFRAIQSKFSISNTVSVTADDWIEVITSSRLVFEFIEAQHYIAGLTAVIWCD